MSLHTQNSKTTRTERQVIADKIKQMCVFAVLGTLLFASKLIMEFLPNVHVLGMLIAVYTLVFGKKALIPIYLFVFLTGIYAGFSAWWVPYLYVWTVLWGMVMLIPRRIPRKAACIVYPIVCAIHGFAFGVIYAPGQALMYGFNLQQTLAWIAMGFPFDIIHGISNLFTGMFVLPIAENVGKLYYGKFGRI